MPDEAYRPAEKLVRWLTILLIAYAVFCLLAAWGGWRQVQAMERIAEIRAAEAERRAEQIEDGEPTQSWVDAYILPGNPILIALGQFVTGTALIVLFCLWIPRANRNARALGAQGMRFTPRWCVIWYLIPVLNLFRPYQAMREIWLASDPADGRRWPEQQVPLLLPLWWGLWLASVFTYPAIDWWPWHGFDEPWRATGATILADAVDAPLSIAALLLVRQIHARQEHSRTTTVFD